MYGGADAKQTFLAKEQLAKVCAVISIRFVFEVFENSVDIHSQCFVRLSISFITQICLKKNDYGKWVLKHPV